MTPNQIAIAQVSRMLVNVETEQKALVRTLGILQRQEPAVASEPRRPKEPQTFGELLGIDTLFEKAVDALVEDGLTREQVYDKLR